MKIGVYVRTKKGEIFDCYENEQMHKPIYYPKKSKTNGFIDYNEVYKKSNNIIDILEVGDYVNGYLVIEKDINNELRYIDLKDRNMKYVKYLDIKSILTKEKFSCMEYKIGE